MNALDRVMNTIQGLPSDRVPVFAVLGARGARLTGTSLRHLYSDAGAWVKGQVALQDTYGLDLVISPFDYSAIGEAFGGSVAWSEHQAPNLRIPGSRTVREALASAMPDPRGSGRLPMLLEAVESLARIYRGAVPVFGVLPGPCNLPSLILGMETWLETLLFDPGGALAILERTGEFCVTWARAILDAGATALVVTEGMAASEILPRGMFSQQCLPHLRHVFSQVGGPWVIHHTGGSIGHVVDLLPGLPGLLGIALGSRDDLGEARRMAGRMTLIGNVDNLGFPVSTPGQIRVQATACLRAAAPAGPYILCNSGADIPLSTPDDCIHAFLDASLAYAGGTS